MPRIDPKTWVTLLGLTIIFILIIEWIQAKPVMAQATSGTNSTHSGHFHRANATGGTLAGVLWQPIPADLERLP